MGQADGEMEKLRYLRDSSFHERAGGTVDYG